MECHSAEHIWVKLEILKHRQLVSSYMHQLFHSKRFFSPICTCLFCKLGSDGTSSRSFFVNKTAIIPPGPQFHIDAQHFCCSHVFNPQFKYRVLNVHTCVCICIIWTKLVYKYTPTHASAIISSQLFVYCIFWLEYSTICAAHNFKYAAFKCTYAQFSS